MKHLQVLKNKVLFLKILNTLINSPSSEGILPNAQAKQVEGHVFPGPLEYLCHAEPEVVILLRFQG